MIADLCSVAPDMASLLEFLLLAAFFAGYLWKGIFFATGILMVGSVLVLSISYWQTRKLQPLPLAVAVLALVLGSATLLLHDPAYIKWKFSVVEWLFGGVFLVTHFMQQTFTERMLGTKIKLPDFVWRRLNLVWACFFLLLGSINVYVIYHFDTAGWIRFKVWWSSGAMLVFVLLQAIYLSRHMDIGESS